MTTNTRAQQLPRISDEQRYLLWNLILAHQKSGSDNEAAKQTSRAVDDQVTSMMTAYGRQCAQEAVERQRIDVTAASVQMEPVDGRNLRSAADLGCVPSKTDLRMYNYKPGGA